jgi:hypothetical protein
MTPTDPHDAHHHGSAGGRYDDGVPHHHGDADPLHNPDVAHEHTDVNLSAIGTAAGIIAGVVVVVWVLMWLLFGWLERDALAREPELSRHARPPVQMPRTTTGSPFFGPGGDGVQLLTSEPMALRLHRENEARRLGSYGWVDEGTGVAHMPIEEAKKLLVERGVAAREFEEADPTLGTRLHAAGESSGGRRITGVLPETAEASEEQPATEQEQQPAAPAETAKPHGSGGH